MAWSGMNARGIEISSVVHSVSKNLPDNWFHDSSIPWTKSIPSTSQNYIVELYGRTRRGQETHGAMPPSDPTPHSEPQHRRCNYNLDLLGKNVQIRSVTGGKAEESNGAAVIDCGLQWPQTATEISAGESRRGFLMSSGETSAVLGPGLIIQGCVSNNQDLEGAGVMIANGVTARLNKVLIRSCHSVRAGGGGIFVSGSDLTLEDVQVENSCTNTVVNDVVAYTYERPTMICNDVQVRHCLVSGITVRGNQAAFNGNGAVLTLMGANTAIASNKEWKHFGICCEHPMANISIVAPLTANQIFLSDMKTSRLKYWGAKYKFGDNHRNHHLCCDLVKSKGSGQIIEIVKREEDNGNANSSAVVSRIVYESRRGEQEEQLQQQHVLQQHMQQQQQLIQQQQQQLQPHQLPQLALLMQQQQQIQQLQEQQEE